MTRLNNDFKTANGTIKNTQEIGEALLKEEITGIVIENFLTKKECEAIVNAFNEIELSEKTIVNEGFHTLPLSFAQFTQLKDSGKMSTKEYVKKAHEFRVKTPLMCGINLEQRLIEQFKDLFPEKTCDLMWNSECKNHLIPFNFRELKPGFGELVTHCENLFFSEFPSFFSWLNKHNVNNNRFSFFITLQNTELGGELCCYNLSWNTVRERVDFKTLRDIHGRTIVLKDAEADLFKIKPKVGSLLLFNGGNIWHRVEKVMGEKSRITVGGFVSSSSQNNNKLLMWA